MTVSRHFQSPRTHTRSYTDQWVDDPGSHACLGASLGAAHVPRGDAVTTSLGFRIAPVAGAGTGVSAGNTDRGAVGRAVAPSPEASRDHGVREVARESEGQRTE